MYAHLYFQNKSSSIRVRIAGVNVEVDQRFEGSRFRVSRFRVHFDSLQYQELLSNPVCEDASSLNPNVCAVFVAETSNQKYTSIVLVHEA